jgi:hypothetical protein
VPVARVLAGVKTQVKPSPEYLKVPETAAPPCVKVNVAAVSVVGSIALLKVTAILVLVATPVAPLTGVVKVTVGGVAGWPGCPPPWVHPVVKRTLRIKINKK